MNTHWYITVTIIIHKDTLMHTCVITLYDYNDKITST